MELSLSLACFFVSKNRHVRFKVDFGLCPFVVTACGVNSNDISKDSLGTSKCVNRGRIVRPVRNRCIYPCLVLYS